MGDAKRANPARCPPGLAEELPTKMAFKPCVRTRPGVDTLRPRAHARVSRTHCPYILPGPRYRLGRRRVTARAVEAAPAVAQRDVGVVTDDEVIEEFDVEEPAGGQGGQVQIVG
jgi:hypothetical protein